MIHIETDRFLLSSRYGLFSIQAPLLGEVWWSDEGWGRTSPAAAAQQRQAYIERNRQTLKDVLGLDIADMQIVREGEQVVAA